MTDLNIYVSNGTCYTAAGEKLDGSFIPCGNHAFGYQTCCGAGDNCLADNACFGVHGSGYGSYLTYMAGCTDPDYKDTTCPDKKAINQPWIALTLCDNSDGAWAACSQDGNPSTLQPGSYCSCTDAASATVAFSDSTSLTNICSLPQSTGESIQFIAGHFPTSPAAAGTTAGLQSAGSSGGSATATQSVQTTSMQGGTGAGSSGATVTRTGSNTSPPGSTSADHSDASSHSGLSSGTKIGIGVGAAIGALILLGAMAALLVFRRKRRRSTQIGKPASKPEGVSDTPTMPRTPEAIGKAVLEADGKAVSEADGKAVSKADRPGVSEADGQAILETDGNAARPWSMRSELEGSQVVPNLTVGDASSWRARLGRELSLVAELPGSNNWQGRGQAPVQEGLDPPEWGATWRV